MFKTDEKTRNYFYFSAVRRNAQQKPRKLNMQTRLVIDFGGQIETKYNRISILVI